MYRAATAFCRDAGSTTGFVHILGLHLSAVVGALLSLHYSSIAAPVVVHWCCPEQRQEPAYLNPPNPLFKGAHQGLRAFHRRSAALPANSGPASEDAFPEEFRLRSTLR